MLLVVVFIYVYHVNHVSKNTEAIWSDIPACSADGTRVRNLIAKHF
jgi:hypothetical protein